MIHTNTLKKITSGGLLTFMALGSWVATTEKTVATSSQTDVTVELMLSIDISGSVSSDEYNLQMDGYAAAFRDSQVISTIESLPNGLAVGVQFWAFRPAPAEDWTLIRTAQEANAFADYLDTLARPDDDSTSLYQWDNGNTSIGRGTNVTGAITAATDEIRTNDFNGDVLVIDVSGDGKSYGKQYNGDNTYDGDCGNYLDEDDICQGLVNARNAAVALGITVNGLPIENGSNNANTVYFDANVKGGTSAFVETASGFDDFTRAAKEKIYQEVSAALTPNAQDDFITTNEDTVATYNLIDGDPNNANAGKDTDPNGDGLTVTNFYVNSTEQTIGQEISMPSGALLTVASNGDVTYNPNGQFEDYNAGDSLPTTDEFTYVVSDPSGYTDGATVTLDINGVADNPVAVDNTTTTDEDNTKGITVIKNDNDPDTSKEDLMVTEINGISVSVNEKVTLTSGATVQLKMVKAEKQSTNGQHKLKYDPRDSNSMQLMNEGESSQETFSYTVMDPEGNTDTATVNVNVTGITDTFAD